MSLFWCFSEKACTSIPFELFPHHHHKPNTMASLSILHGWLLEEQTTTLIQWHAYSIDYKKKKKKKLENKNYLKTL
jgi:hypothetical protein